MKNKFIGYLAIIAVLFMGACDDETLGPVLDTSDSSLFISAEFVNVGNTDGEDFEVTADNLEDVFEAFSWTYSGSDYAGVKVPRTYAIQVDAFGDGFAEPFTLTTTTATDADITVSDFNSAVLSIGGVAGTTFNAVVRLQTTVTGQDLDTLYSDSVAFNIIPYRDSECGTYCSMGLIGDASMGGWSVDTDMTMAEPDGDRSKWEVITYLETGKSLKFRAGDAWTENWGDDAGNDGVADFNSGTNISFSEPTGWYKVEFNDNTLEYAITAMTATEYTSMGIIGHGTPTGWDSDTDFTKGSDGHSWTLDLITLVDGEAKFRANDGWDDDWGDNEQLFPSGTAEYKGSNIPVTGGDRAVYFHDVIGSYYFMTTANKDPYSSIGVIGTGSPSGNWDTETGLTQNPNDPYLWSGFLNLNDGIMKFRADNAWDVNWGGSTPIQGIGTQGGPDIPVEAGSYFVVFNSGTGEYHLFK